MCVGHYMGGVMYGGHPSDNGANHSGKGSITHLIMGPTILRRVPYAQNSL